MGVFARDDLELIKTETELRPKRLRAPQKKSARRTLEEGLAAEADELNVEEQRRAGRDVGRRAALSVCHTRRANRGHPVRIL